MKLEGSDQEVDIPEGKITVTVKNTNAKELMRLSNTIHTLFEQGVFNARNGNITLSFNAQGFLGGISVQASKWAAGKPIITRVALFDEAIVEIDATVLD